MRKGEALKNLLEISGMELKVVFNGISLMDARIAVQIWEELNAEVDTPKREEAPVPKPSTNPTGKKKPLDDGKMLALRKAGWTYEKIADEMRCSAQTVINHIKERE